ncbi:hypothetical protein OGAPHI_003829 [Ogataea philodendri]|uniref:Uncharacterized protein n=1 Tax=Ogataea philodendri TaxID=1378263 RepID=A0A9P8T4E3_9ASCO|nr:uncharacterized protein OGAPHI_003829 [Ogataea philodendri]KAH3665641.1 hypothetical protein OGAPHI_003829 [Ogataea philodendri]
MSFKSAFGLEYRMFGVSTVARLWISILDPFSSSIKQNDATQLKNENSTSARSLCTFGSMQYASFRIWSRLATSSANL